MACGYDLIVARALCCIESARKTETTVHSEDKVPRALSEQTASNDWKSLLAKLITETSPRLSAWASLCLAFFIRRISLQYLEENRKQGRTREIQFQRIRAIPSSEHSSSHTQEQQER